MFVLVLQYEFFFKKVKCKYISKCHCYDKPFISVLITCHNSSPLPDPQQLCDSTSYCETRYGSNSGSNQDNFRGADPVNNQRTVGGSDDDGSFTKEYLFDQDFPFGQGTKDTGCPTIGVPKVRLSFSLILKG